MGNSWEQRHSRDMGRLRAGQEASLLCYYRAYSGTWWYCSRSCWFHQVMEKCITCMAHRTAFLPPQGSGGETRMSKEQWGKAVWLSAGEDFSRLSTALLEGEVWFI